MFGRKRAKAVDLRSLDDLKALLAEGKPVLIDFMQPSCPSCRVMDGILSELAADYEGSAHIVRVDVTRVTGAIDAFMIRATPTFVLLGRPSTPAGKKAKRRQPPVEERAPTAAVARWRAAGLVRKDLMTRALESAGAVPAASRPQP
jgi:thiol-disulfide isomerase/thioredoxin